MVEALQNTPSPFQGRRAIKGQSDSVKLDCSCNLNGTCLLFYKFFHIEDPSNIAKIFTNLCSDKLTGKIRIANEGINVTVAGISKDIENFINEICDNLPFLSEFKNSSTKPFSKKARFDFFKPSRGCIHIFDNLSIKVVTEICPLNLTPTPHQSTRTTTSTTTTVSPKEFHELLSSNDPNTVVLDTRNYYESKIGKFSSALTPSIRKFSSFPEYLAKNKLKFNGKRVLNYCTGGIRCSKLMDSLLFQSELENAECIMLDGGIHNYLEWVKKEEHVQSLFLGSNYVFDARVIENIDDHEIISCCKKCLKASEAYIKCSGAGCHLLIVICGDCQVENNFCCVVCDERDVLLKKGSKKAKSIQCTCDIERRKLL